MGFALNALPLDILSTITGYLNSVSLFRLCLSGDHALHDRFEKGGVLHVNYYPYSLVSPHEVIKLPAFVRSFRQLRSIYIIPRSFATETVQSAASIPIVDVDSFKGLSEHLNSVIFIFSYFKFALRPIENLEQLNAMYPRLNCIQGLSYATMKSATPYLNHLKELEVGFFDTSTDSQLPLDNLEHLKVTQRVVLSQFLQQAPIQLPSTLLSFDIGDSQPFVNESVWIKKYLQSSVQEIESLQFNWPPHLRSLRLRTPLVHSALALPSTLVFLEIADFSAPLGWTESLPRSLKTLIVAHILATDEAIQGLPRSLTYLNSLVCESNESSLDYLPPNLTYLTLVTSSDFDGDCLPFGLKTLNMDPPPPKSGDRNWKVQNLPPFITELNIGASTVKSVISFKPSTRKAPRLEDDHDSPLDIDADYEDVSSEDDSAMDIDHEPTLLPITTCSMALCNSQPFESTLSFLPPTVTKLCLTFRTLGIELDWLSWLPRSLLEFHFSGFLTDSHLSAKSASNPDSLSTSAGKAGDNLEPTLPPSLTALRLQSPSSAYYSVTSTSLKHLPRSLLHLRADLRSLHVDDLSLLPPTLVSAVLTAPSHGEPPLGFSVQALQVLPPFLRYLNLGWQILNIDELQRAFRPREIVALNQPMTNDVRSLPMPRSSISAAALTSIMSVRK